MTLPLPGPAGKRKGGEVLGPPPLDRDAEDDVLARWPHLARGGPQACNQLVSGDLETQLRLAASPRPVQPYPSEVAARLAATFASNVEAGSDLALALAPALGPVMKQLADAAVREALERRQGPRRFTVVG